MYEDMLMMRIGEVAKNSNVGVETVRFYEREGLITLPKRNQSGYRQYPESVIKQIQFVQHAKSLGFSLKEIRELIKLKSTSSANCKTIKVRAKAKIADIQDKIDALERMKLALQPLVARCKSSDPISECPILSALDEET
jgi:MerR family copper efflux transcriptional regulator